MTSYFRFVFLLLPVLALAIFVTWLPRAPQGKNAPIVAQEESKEQPRSIAQIELELELEEIAERFPGEVGIAVYDIAADRMASANGEAMLPQQSVSKLWVAMTALAQADERDLDLGERVVIRREDLTLFHQPIRDIVRRQGMFSSDYADLIDRALTRSDNTANDRILRRVGGPEEVEEFLDDRDIEGIRFGPDERTKQSAIAGLTWNQSYSYGNSFYEARDEVPDAVRRSAFERYLADPIDGATAEGIALALGRLVRGELLSSVSTEYLLQILSETRSGPNRLKGGLPPGWTIAHKTGTGQFFDGEQSGYNDVGVVTSDSGNQYGVAVLIARTRSSYAARMGMMHEVVRAIETYENREYAAAVDAA